MKEPLKTVGIYLAAGTSSRMWVDKRYLPFGTLPLGSCALHEAIHSKLENIVVVGRTDDSFEWLSIVDEHKLKMVHTSPHATCQSHSLQTGLDVAISLQAQAVVVILADQPFVTRDQINILIEAFQRACPKKPLFIASKYQDAVAPPILLSKFLFPEIMLLTGDNGAKKILENHQGNGLFVHFSDSLWTIDIDTPEIYKQVFMTHVK